MFTILRQRRLEHLRRMKDGIFPKISSTKVLIAGKTNLEHTQLRYQDTCKRNELEIDL